MSTSDPDYDKFVRLHQDQLTSSLVPQHLWPALCKKLNSDSLDAGSVFKIEIVQYEDDDGSDVDTAYRVISIEPEGIRPDDPDQIYLIDHMWTFRLTDVKQRMKQLGGIVDRLASLMDIDSSDKQELPDLVFKEMWKWTQCYSLKTGDTESSLPVWYVMDEFGSRIQHSIDPNCRCVPFYYSPKKMAYSLLFPVKTVEFGGEITRNYIDGECILSKMDEMGSGEAEVLVRSLLMPWQEADLTHVSFQQEDADDEFVRSSRIEESLPRTGTEPALPENRKVKVYAEYSFIKNFLTLTKVEFVGRKEDADILWLAYHFKDYHELSVNRPNTLINQFPFEHILTVKDLFAATCRRNIDSSSDNIDTETLESSPEWLATTYNLLTELPKFVSYFQHRKKKGLDNHWICKPWNLARGLDTVITDNLDLIIRLRNMVPKVVCKYITDPVLFKRDDLNDALVKFDIRYIVLLQSVEPLRLFVYKKFWLRFANKPFSLDSFDDYEKHFTVMNYADDVRLKHLQCDKFIEKFEQQYPEYRWCDVQQNILACLRSAFERAIVKPPPFGIAANRQSRAMYAVDLMLRWDQVEGRRKMQPVLLELNWAPDCQRACLYYPDFFNDVFSVLFFNDNSNDNVILI